MTVSTDKPYLPMGHHLRPDAMLEPVWDIVTAVFTGNHDNLTHGLRIYKTSLFGSVYDTLIHYKALWSEKIH